MKLWWTALVLVVAVLVSGTALFLLSTPSDTKPEIGKPLRVCAPDVNPCR